MHLVTDAARPAAARFFLTAALLCSAGVQAQTLIDTSAAIGVQNTLLEQQPVPGRLPAVALPSPASPAASATPPAPVPAPSAEAPAAARPVTPLTAEQQAALVEAQASYAAGNYPLARAQYEALIVRNFAHPDPHFGLGLTLYALGDLRGAAFEFGQFVVFAPGRFEGPYNLGVIATREERFAEALRLYQTAAQLAGPSAPPTVRAQVLRALAAEQTRIKDYLGLSETYSALVALNPQSSGDLYRRAQSLYLAERYDEALPATYAALQAQPASLSAALLLADVYMAQGLPDRATRELGAAVARVNSGSERSALLLRKAELLTQTDPRSALQAASDARREDTRNAGAFAREGELLAGLGERAAAIAAYRRAAHLDDKNPRHQAALAGLYLAGNEYARARNAVALTLKLKPDAAITARMQYVQGVVAYRQGRSAEALALLRASAQVAPSGEALLWLGLSQYALGDYAAAATTLGESVRLSPTPLARQNLASALLATARYAEAEALARGLVTDGVKNADGWYLLGLAQRAQQRANEARQSFKKAAALGDRRAQDALK
ncbi:Tetratricopeptide repeat-containing protein [Deinococcus reticulitermitis]|uniref:Tetratricopeptide repeat-containing protein n=1 Tax=Deinococcus reticulitermitis TaxID=856736 RepID=A0A1H6XU50_9DEIO|nr:tetratricopeptide repeat protein [Deinococcus reticulitermitis]SEJ28422.1 Tetratricopeptide repeat-containing protein [Deinococcus reticulitermitis]